jgi:hypothetical protein
MLGQEAGQAVEGGLEGSGIGGLRRFAEGAGDGTLAAAGGTRDGLGMAAEFGPAVAGSEVELRLRRSGC